MNKHSRKSLISGQHAADQRLRDKRLKPTIAFADAAPESDERIS